MHGRGRWQGKRDAEFFWDGVCGKWGIVLFGVNSLLQKDKKILSLHLGVVCTGVEARVAQPITGRILTAKNELTSCSINIFGVSESFLKKNPVYI